MANKIIGRNGTEFGIFSFFTGAGFLDLGFEDAGFRSYLANELDSNFASVYRYSRAQMKRPMPVFGMQEGDVCSYLNDESKVADLTCKISSARKDVKLVGFIGGPPCPDFSVANANAQGELGRRGVLTRVYVDLICVQEPDFFVMENVKGLVSTARHREFFGKMTDRLHDAGYATSFRLVNAMEYGAAQDRQRVMLVGVKESLCRSHIEKGKHELSDFPWNDFVRYPMEKIRSAGWPTTDRFMENGKRDAPRGIIKPLTVQYWFDRNDVENHPNAKDFFVPRAGLVKMRIYAEGDDSKKCYKRVHRWRYSPTACYGNNEVHLHPYKARRMSVAETLAIQSLPKSFSLPQDIPLSAKFKTIGNGVPYLAARGVALTLKKFLQEILSDGTKVHG